MAFGKDRIGPYRIRLEKAESRNVLLHSARVIPTQEQCSLCQTEIRKVLMRGEYERMIRVSMVN